MKRAFVLFHDKKSILLVNHGRQLNASVVGRSITLIKNRCFAFTTCAAAKV